MVFCAGVNFALDSGTSFTSSFGPGLGLNSVSRESTEVLELATDGDDDDPSESEEE